MNKKFLTSTSLLVLAIFFIVATVISNNVFKSTRFDLTNNKLYTLSEGAKSIVQKIPEPINLYYFFSDKVTQGSPQLQTYGSRVRELLEEFATHSDGKLVLQVIDPEPFSEDEDKATEFGLRGQPFGRSGDKLYFGLAATNSIGNSQVIPTFSGERESFLEYDISKLIYELSHPAKKTIGVLSSLPIEGVVDQQRQQQQVPPLMIYEYMKQSFDVRKIAPDADFIDADIDVLVVVHPQGVSENMLFAIDQFALSGGNLMVFVDPVAESQRPQQGSFEIPDRASDMASLFKVWGFELLSGKVIGDMTYSLSVNAGAAGAVSHPNFLALDEKVINRDEAITSELDLITIGMAGELRQIEGATTQFTPLIQSSEKSMLFDSTRYNSFVPVKPQDLLLEFQPTGEQRVIAARVSGKFATAFPDGNPSGENGESALTEAASDVNVIVVADTDMLQDNMWVRVQRVFGQAMAQPWSDNGDFVINAIETLTGNNDLIGIRSRGEFSRPFELVIELQREAELKFHEKEQQLQAELEETEKELSNLQSSKDSSNQLILSPEQQLAIENFRDKQVKIRKQLREVRHALDKDIENLGITLKFINIGLVPLLLVLLALGMALTRVQRRTLG